jgi:hypothetical protein
MLDEVPVVVCVINASEQTIFGRLRDGRSRKITVTAANGARGTGREPLWATPLAAVTPGQTGCVEGLASTLVRPAINLWTDRPVHVLLNGREDYADCRIPRALTAGTRLTYTYTPSACRLTETR